MRPTRGSYANVTATLALLVALGGTSYAAVELAKNSVGAKQLKANAVTTKKVKDGSLLSQDFTAGQLVAGPQGPAGAGRARRRRRDRLASRAPPGDRRAGPDGATRGASGTRATRVRRETRRPGAKGDGRQGDRPVPRADPGPLLTFLAARQDPGRTLGSHWRRGRGSGRLRRPSASFVHSSTT